MDSLSETEAGSPISAVDGLPIDLLQNLDEGYDGGATAIDGSDGRTPSRPDGGPKDTPVDPPADRVSADARDAAQVDTRRADAPDAPSIIKDTRDAISADSRDVTAPDPKDAPSVVNQDVSDAPYGPEVPDAAEVADVVSVQPEVGTDTAEVAPTSLDSAQGLDTQDTSALEDAANDSRDVSADRMDSSGPESRPEAPPACPGQEVRCRGVCVDLMTSPSNCGLCGNDCSPLHCIGGLCTLCPTEQTFCDGQCVDTSTDPTHCGGCGQVCPSGACRFGECKPSTAGNIVVIGHDFLTNNVAMSRLLGNAILSSATGDVVVVEYLGSPSSTAVSNSHVAISQVASTFDRKVTLLSSPTYSSSSLASQLKSADVFLIQSQTSATDSRLLDQGQTWASVLSTFVHTGGTVVVLDASYPVNDGTTQILAGANLMEISVLALVNNDTCTVATASDPVAAGLPASYPCLKNTVVFSGDGTHVVEDLGRPVVLHVAF